VDTRTDPSRRLDPLVLGWGLTLLTLSNPVVSLLRTERQWKWGADIASFAVAPALLAVAVFWLPKLWHSRRSVAAAFVELPALAPLCLWALLSTAWSVAPRRTAVHASMLCAATILAVLAGRCLDERGRRRALIVVLAVVIPLAVVFALLLPQYGLSNGYYHAGAWRGPYNHKNGLGAVLGAGILAAVFEVCDRSGWRRIAALLVGAGCVLLWMAKSVSPILSLGAAVAVFLAMRLYGRMPLRLRRGLLLSSPVLVVIALGIASRPGALEMVGRDATLTGRTAIWRCVIARIAERPVAGYGYLAYWQAGPGIQDISAAAIAASIAERGEGRGDSGAQPVIAEQGEGGGDSGDQLDPALAVSTSTAPEAGEEQPWRAMSAHNGLLEVALDLGIVGAVLLLVHLVLAVARFWRRFTPDGRNAGVAFMAYLLTLGLLEATLLQGWSVWGLLWLTGITYSTLPAPEPTAS
jgi:O-antigen ligase